MRTELATVDRIFADLEASLLSALTKAENAMLKARVRELEYQVRYLSGAE